MCLRPHPARYCSAQCNFAAPSVYVTALRYVCLTVLTHNGPIQRAGTTQNLPVSLVFVFSLGSSCLATLRVRLLLYCCPVVPLAASCPNPYTIDRCDLLVNPLHYGCHISSPKNSGIEDRDADLWTTRYTRIMYEKARTHDRGQRELYRRLQHTAKKASLVIVLPLIGLKAKYGRCVVGISNK